MRLFRSLTQPTLQMKSLGTWFAGLDLVAPKTPWQRKASSSPQLISRLPDLQYRTHGLLPPQNGIDLPNLNFRLSSISHVFGTRRCCRYSPSYCMLQYTHVQLLPRQQSEISAHDLFGTALNNDSPELCCTATITVSTALTAWSYWPDPIKA